jgi:AraC family transcriptional regulator
MNANRARYVARLRSVVEYIDAHLHEDLSLERLAGIAHFSPFHFHRLFAAMTGETLADCIRRRRLEAAATRLLTQPRRSVLEIAIDTGFEGAEVFARAFRRHFGCSASQWRRGAWREKSVGHMQQLAELRPAQRKNDQAANEWRADHGSMNPAWTSQMPVIVETLPAYRVAYLRYVGPYGPGIAETWRELRRWSQSRGLQPLDGLRIGIVRDNPHVTEPSKCRYDTCMAVDDRFRAAGEIGVQRTPGGRYGCHDFTGTAGDITAAWNWLYAEWLPDSGHELGDGALMEIFRDERSEKVAQPPIRCRLCLPLAQIEAGAPQP